MSFAKKREKYIAFFSVKITFSVTEIGSVNRVRWAPSCNGPGFHSFVPGTETTDSSVDLALLCLSRGFGA